MGEISEKNDKSKNGLKHKLLGGYNIFLVMS